MAEPRLINGKLHPRAKDGESFILRIQLYGEDANRFEQFCIDNEFELSTQALRALVVGGMADWPKWGVMSSERKRVATEFRREMSRRWALMLDQMLKELRTDLESLEVLEPAHAHQT